MIRSNSAAYNDQTSALIATKFTTRVTKRNNENSPQTVEVIWNSFKANVLSTLLIFIWILE